MNQHKHEPQEAVLHMSIQEQPWMQFLLQHGKLIGASALGLLVLAILITQFALGGSSKADSDYWGAENDLIRLGKADTAPQALAHLQTILLRRPELHAKYDGRIAEELLIQNKPKEALPFAMLALTRTREELGPYALFTDSTLDIAQKRYREALTRSLTQKGPPLLQAATLLRTAFLYQELGEKTEEKLAWEAVLKLDGVQPFLRTFSEGNISLTEYIAMRQALLK